MHKSVCSSYELIMYGFLFFFNDTATTEIYTLSLHDALPICPEAPDLVFVVARGAVRVRRGVHVEPLMVSGRALARTRSEEHTSELQSRQYLVCRLLLEKKKNISSSTPTSDQYLIPSLLTLVS